MKVAVERQRFSHPRPWARPSRRRHGAWGAVRNIDARVLTGRLGQSLLEPLLEGTRHLLDKGLFLLL